MNDEQKLYRIFEGRMHRLWRAAGDHKVFDIKLWHDYIHELGMEFADSCEDDRVCVRDPLRQQMRYVSMKKETALKILVLGELP